MTIFEASSSRRRKAVTLVELLVVLSICVLLAGLLLPAIIAAREAARKLTCSANIRSLGLASLNYEAALRSLPPASIWSKRGLRLTSHGIQLPGTYDYSASGTDWRNDGFRSGLFLALLPYLEQSPLYDRWDFHASVSAPQNATLRGTRIPVFLCPSDPFTDEAGEFQGGNWARGCYAVNAGPNSRCLSNPIFIPGVGDTSFCELAGMPRAHGVEVSPLNPFLVSRVWGSGVAGVNRSFRLAELTDGTSTTVLLDELRAGVGPLDRRGTWALPMVGSSITFGSGIWNYGGIAPNVCLSIADQIQDCNAIRASMGEALESQCMPCRDFEGSFMATPRSMHRAGVQTCMADGSVRMIDYSIDLQVWTAIHTRAEGEVVPQIP